VGEDVLLGDVGVALAVAEDAGVVDRLEELLDLLPAHAIAS
jgi:hypothetical protein